MAPRRLVDELIDAYLDNSFEQGYLLDIETGQVVIDAEESMMGESAIDWEDGNSLDRYWNVPQISSEEAFWVRMRFAQRTDSDPDDLLLDALSQNRPFRRFKDALTELELWPEWDAFERNWAQEELKPWLDELPVSYAELNARYLRSLGSNP